VTTPFKTAKRRLSPIEAFFVSAAMTIATRRQKPAVIDIKVLSVALLQAKCFLLRAVLQTDCCFDYDARNQRSIDPSKN